MACAAVSGSDDTNDTSTSRLARTGSTDTRDEKVAMVASRDGGPRRGRRLRGP